MRAPFLERHLQMTPALLPLGGAGFVMLVARPEAEAEADGMILPAKTRTFRVPGDVGIQLHRRTLYENPFQETPGQTFLATSHVALTCGHQANPRHDLADLPLDLDRRFHADRGLTLRIAA